MAAVSVFVDDAVRGELPMVCVKTGQPADILLRTQLRVGGGASPWAWVLVLLGPPGWLAVLVVLMITSGGEYLTVRLPETEAAFARQRSLERFRLGAFLAAALAAVCGVVYRGMFPALWFGLAAASVVAGAMLHMLLRREAIGVHLDASRRWVTLTGVHPRFSEAVEGRSPLVTDAGR